MKTILVLDYMDVTLSKRDTPIEELKTTDFRYPIMPKIYEAHGVVFIDRDGQRRIYKNQFW